MKVLGWGLFVGGILYLLIAPPATADFSGSYPWADSPGGLTLHLVIALTAIIGGWKLAHRRSVK